jgi:hypothetical protein
VAEPVEKTAEEQEWADAVARLAAFVKEIETLTAENRRDEVQIAARSGGGPDRLRPVLAQRRERLAAVRAAAALEQRRVGECHRAASRARSEMRREEYSALVCNHANAVLAVAASVRDLERLIAEVTDGGLEFTLASRFLFRDLGDFGDRLSALRLLLREAHEAGFELPDVARFGFKLPGELQPREEVAQ